VTAGAAAAAVEATASDAPATVRRAARPAPPSGIRRLVVAPDITGPRIRMGALWFFLALAAVTAGRWWTAALAALVASVAGYQVTREWIQVDATEDGVEPAAGVEPTAGVGTEAGPETDAEGLGRTDREPRAPRRPARSPALVAALLAAGVPLAAGYGTGAAGLVLLGAAATAGLVRLAGGARAGSAVAIGAILPGIAAASIVLALQVELWAALFLVLAVSFYDAGSFLMGSEAAKRWEGPVAGILGTLAVTFTMSTIQVPPLDRAQWWIAGACLVLTCAPGQLVTGWFLPEPSSRVPAMRRLDAYVIAGPVYLGCLWALGI
jgi:hypothetical protein